MAQPKSGGTVQGGHRTALKTLIEQWKELRQKIEGLIDEGQDLQAKIESGEAASTAGPDENYPERIQEIEAELNGLRDERADTVDDIDAMIAKRPQLWAVAEARGFRMNLLTADVPDRYKTTSNDSDERGGIGTDDDESPGKRDDKGGPGDNRPRNRGGGGNAGLDLDTRLPGVRGNHYDIVRYGGKVYARYHVKVGDKTVEVAWRINDKDFDAQQVQKGEGKMLTKKQFLAMQMFGTSDEIERRNGGNKHPFKKWVEQLEATYGDVSILRNKETLAILAAGFLEQMDPTEIEGRLRQTKWYQSRTAYQREWEMVKTREEREQILGRTKEQIVLGLDELYGNKNWRNFVDEGKVDDWAEKVSSGKWDEPGAAFASLMERLRKEAAGVEGSSAFVEEQQDAIADREFMNRPEEVREELRGDALMHLGPAGVGREQDARLDGTTLDAWAEDIASGRKSGADWTQFLRRQKKGLYPWLDDDETWQDAASPFKAIGEALLGETSMSWADQFLGDLEGKDANGKPLGQRLSAYDFERKVRESDRFWNGRRASEEGAGLTRMLEREMLGVG